MIRRFEKKDAERVMKLWLEGNLQAHGFVPGDYWVKNFDMVKEQLSEADVFVYEQGEAILGFVGMVGDYLAGIFVDEKSRSHGAGKALLDFIKENHKSFSLNVYKKNQGAFNFYLREGLSVIEERTDEATGETEYTMTYNEK